MIGGPLINSVSIEKNALPEMQEKCAVHHLPKFFSELLWKLVLVNESR